ncbi:MAG: Arm DNA-binding domain-containing protein [Gammaproteobacteria bacterium]|nr:Arm DNA-binding domain-containing protein [Gammaproteobacteria bacterium]
MWNDSTIRGMETRDKRYRRAENIGRRGVGRLVIEIRPDGVKNFFFQYFRNSGGKSERLLIRIGRYKESARQPGFSLAEARDRALELSDLVKRGEDPKIVQEEERRLEEERHRQIEAEKRQGNFEQLLDSYLANMEANGKRTYKSVSASPRNVTLRHPFPQLLKRRASEIEADNVRTILGRMLDKGVTTHTNRVRSYLHAAFQRGLAGGQQSAAATRRRRRQLESQQPRGRSSRSRLIFERVGEHVITAVEELALTRAELSKFAPDRWSRL